MINGKDDIRAGGGQADITSGSGGRRRWSASDKARIVAESLAPGVSASQVAHRWGVDPRRVYAWRRGARGSVATLPRGRGEAGLPEPALVAIVAEPGPAEAAPLQRAAGFVPVIEVEVAGAVVRVSPGLDGGLLAMVLRAVRASAGEA